MDIKIHDTDVFIDGKRIESRFARFALVFGFLVLSVIVLMTLFSFMGLGIATLMLFFALGLLLCIIGWAMAPLLLPVLAVVGLIRQKKKPSDSP